MGCGYCKEDGHTINTCKAEGVEEEKLRRMSDPKEIRKREKAREKREEKVKALHDKHDIAEASEEVCLHRPSIVPGHVHDSFLQRCKTVEGVIECLLTEELVQVREERSGSNHTAEGNAWRWERCHHDGSSEKSSAHS